MRIIEVEALANGAHRNQTPSAPVALPDGWAVVPDGLATPNFPFGTIEVEAVDGVMTVKSWAAGTIPEPEPVPEAEPTELEQLRADVDFIAMETGVEL